MKKALSSLFILLVATNIAIASAAPKPNKPALSFEKIIVPEAPPVASVMVAYMNIKNNSNKTQVITQIMSPQFKRVEIHKMSMANGMMDMKQLKTLPIKSKQTVVLETGGLHVMLIKPIKPLRQNDNIEITFKLSSGELATIRTQVRNVDLTNPALDPDKHHH